MSARHVIVALLLLAVSAAACSSRRGGSRQDLEVITRAQLEEGHFQNAYQAVEALRGNWLLVRGTDSFRSPSQIVVYLDNVKLGGIEELRSITTMTIDSMRHFNGVEATSRWGLDHGAGVIQVISRSGGAP